MNSPFLHEQARRLCRERSCRLTGPGGADAEATVRNLYRRVLGRLPENDELALATAFIRGKSGDAAGTSSRPGPTASTEPQLSAWEQLSHVLLLTNEFMFVD